MFSLFWSTVLLLFAFVKQKITTKNHHKCNHSVTGGRGPKGSAGRASRSSRLRKADRCDVGVTRLRNGPRGSRGQDTKSIRVKRSRPGAFPRQSSIRAGMPSNAILFQEFGLFPWGSTGTARRPAGPTEERVLFVLKRFTTRDRMVTFPGRFSLTGPSPFC
jgi:hypothetical protein